MKNVFVLIVLLMTNIAFAQEAPQILMCPLDRGTPVKIDLKGSFLDLDPGGTISFFEKDGTEFPIVKIVCLGHFRPNYQGSISCFGLAPYRQLVRVNIDQHFLFGDIQEDSYVASVLIETSSTNEVKSLAKKSLCSVH